MARPSAIALIALIALAPGLAMAQDEGSTETPAAESTAKATKSQKRLRRKMWTIGGVSWTDSIKLKRSDGAKFDVAEQSYGVQAAYNLLSYKGNWGRSLQFDVLAGQSAYESHDPQLDFFRNRETVYGGGLTYGYYYILARPNVWIGGLASLNLIQHAYHKPKGYSLEDETTRFKPMAKIEFAFPVAKDILVVQQLGIPILDDGTFWMIGARFR